MSTASIIRQARIANNYTQEKFAELVGVHVQSVRNWEKGSTPQSKVAKKIAEILHLTEQDLEPEKVDPVMEFELAELMKAVHKKAAELHKKPIDKIQVSINVLG